LLESRFVAHTGSGHQRVICALCEWKHKPLPNLSHDEKKCNPQSIKRSETAVSSN
jgi:hypothetical protein